MEMVANQGKYILSMLDHKRVHKLADGTEIYLLAEYNNNLRERNPQLGVVEAIPDGNWLELAVGDTVAVNHFTFCGNIGKDKGYILKEHFEMDGKKYFPAVETQIFFKYNNKTPQVLPGYVLHTGVEEKKTLHQDPNTLEFYYTSEYGQRGVITHGNGIYQPGKESIVLKNAFYGITLDGAAYFKTKESEVVAFVEDGEAAPTGNNILVEYLPEEFQSNYLYGKRIGLWLDWQSYKNCDAKVIKGRVKHCIEWNVRKPGLSGRILSVFRNQGVKFNGQWILTDNDMINWIYAEKK